MVVNKNKKQEAGLKASLLILLFKFFAISPRFITRSFAYIIGQLSYFLSSKTKSVIQRNIQICFPQLSNSERDALVKKNSMENAKLALEFPIAWLSQKAKIEALLVEVNNKALVDQYVDNKQPLIIAVPHLGNWEFFWHWLQLNFQAIGMYSPASIPQVDRLMLSARQRFGGQAFATDPKGIMSLLRALKKGRVMMILPDQVPRKDAGIYTPFFGQSAYTMTLLHRFIQKTGANLLFASCLRNKQSNGFRIDIYSPDFDIASSSTENFNLGMNKQIESMILQSPEQYQWSYKRFKRQQDGANFYK